MVGAGAVLSKDINKKITSTRTADLSIYECINFARGAHNSVSNEKALNCLKKSVKNDPNYADAWFWLADRKRAHYSSFSMTDEFLYMLNEASEDVDKGLTLDPQSAFGYTTKVQIEFDEVDEVFLKEQGNRRSACLLSPEDVFKGVKYGN